MSEIPKESQDSDDEVVAVSTAPKATVDATTDATPADLTAKLNRKKWMIFLVVGFLSMFADQATKIWARAELPTQHNVPGVTCVIPEDIVTHACGGVPTTVIDGFWYHRLSMNPGSAFGLFSSQGSARIFLSIVGIIAVFGMVWMLKKARTDQRVLHWALGFVVGGAVGNLIDRIYYGVVTDFVLWKYKTHEWPVFNIADVVLVVGVGLMFIDIQKEGRREKAERKRKVEAAGLVKKL
ncbi:MAG: signal peptidase II [Deltaproteobacteria bacterium]|nr:signal peptidase II [Deltaproteobacteria bacterium]